MLECGCDQCRKDRLCPRCRIGIDDNGDGDCAVCCNLTDEQAAELRKKAQAKEEANGDNIN